MLQGELFHLENMLAFKDGEFQVFSELNDSFLFSDNLL